MAIGPVTNLPDELLRPDVIVVAGEDAGECAAAWDVEWSHAYRGFWAADAGGATLVVAPFGSAAMEALLWELRRRVQRVLLVGTAGALPGFTGPRMEPLAVSSAQSCYQNFDAPPLASFEPSWRLDLPCVEAVSTDRFFGFSTLAESEYPAEPGLSEAWSRHCQRNAVVDMETAAFYHYGRRFFDASVWFGAIRVVANEVEELDALPMHSAAALKLAAVAAQKALA